MKQRQPKIPTIADTLPNNGALLNQHYKSQEELEAAVKANTAALFANLKPEGWTASEEITFHKSKTFMDYLHGDVKNEEAEFACRYEYARESWQVWRAVKIRDEARATGKLKCENDFWAMLYEPEVESWIRVDLLAQSFLMCQSFPSRDWNELSQSEREKIMPHAKRKFEPLRLQILHCWHYPKDKFPEFDKLFEQTQRVMGARPGEAQKPYTEAMTQKSDSIYYCLFVVDFSESKNLLYDRFVAWLKRSDIEQLRQKYRRPRHRKNRDALCSTKTVQWHASIHWCLFEVDLSANKTELAMQFKKWLALRENNRRIKEHKNEKRGTSATWKNRLKDLAVSRLYRESGNKCDEANKFANDNRKKSKQSVPQPFLDAKPIKGKIPLAANECDLFSCDADYRHAKGEIIKVLASLIPHEFKKPNSKMRKKPK